MVELGGWFEFVDQEGMGVVWVQCGNVVYWEIGWELIVEV